MTREELAAALRKADAAGNADDARRLAGAIRQLDAGSAVQAPVRPAMDPLHMVKPEARAQVEANQPMRSLPMSPLGPGNERYAPPKPPPQGDPLAPANPQAAAANVDAQQRARGLVPYTNASTGETYWRPDPARQVADANAQFKAREAAKASAAQAQAENEAFRNSRPDFVNQASDAIRGGFAATENAAFDVVDAGLDAVDPRRKVSQFISQNVTPAAEQLGRSIGGAIEGPSGRFGGMAGPAVGAITGGLSELGATMARDPQDASTQIVDALEPTHMLARGGNTAGDALDAAMGGDFGRSSNLMAQAVPDLIGGSGVLPAMSVTANALRTAARAPQRELAEQLARIQPLPATGRVPMSAPRVAPTVAQTAQQAPTQPQTATAPPVPPIPPNAPAVTAGAPQPVPARSRAEQRADDLLIKKLAADGITMDDVRKIQARLARRGDSGVYETIGEIAALTDKSSGANLRGLQMAGGAAPGPLQEALVGLVNQNTEKLSPRLSRGATRATGQKADNAVATLDELENRLRTEATPAYDDAYATPVNPQVFANEILPVLNTPSGQKALQAARNNLASIAADLQGRAARGASERAMMESQRAQAAVKSIDDFMADPVRGTAIPTTMALDYTKRAFDDVIADAGFGSDTARIVGGTKRNFADSVSQATGGQYGNALGVFEDVKRLEDAFETGLKSLSQPTWELQRAMAKGRNGSPWTAGEVEALAMGVARNIEDLIEANNQSALTKLLKDKALKNMATALGSQKAADMFEETIRRLGANREWGRRVAGGSDTAMRQAAIRDAGMEGEDAVTRVLDRVETSGNQFSLPGLVNDVAVKPIARTAKDIYQRLRYPGVYDEEVNRALIPLIGKPMTEGNLNEVIRRVEARMAEKGLIPPAQPAAVAAPPPAPGRRPRGPRGNPPGTTSSASATGTGIVAGGVLGAMAPADDENEQFINALFTAAGVGTAVGVAAKLSKGGKPPPANGKGAKPKAPPAKPAFDQRFMKEAQRLVSYNGGVDKALKAQQYVIDQLKNSKAPNAQDRLNRAVSVQYAIRRMAERSNRELDEIAPMAEAAPTGPKPIDANTNYNIDPRGDKFVIRTDAGEEVLGAPQFTDRKQALAWLQGETRKARQGGAAPKPRSGPPGVKPPPVKNGLPGGSRDLPMDEGSRMERARSMGFDVDTPLYHGTTHSFDEFSGAGGNVENHHGTGAYFSTSPEDVARNYANPRGADLTNRIESIAERISYDIEDAVNANDYEALRALGITRQKLDGPGIDFMDEARRVARERIQGKSEGATIPTYARLKKPVVVNGGQDALESGPNIYARNGRKRPQPSVQSTRWDYETVYDDAGEEVISEGGPAMELLDATRSALAGTGMPDKYADEIIAKLQDEIFSNEGINADAFERVLRSDGGSIIDYESSPGQIIQDVYRAMGHDGIILKDADRQFSNMGMRPGTDHYVVFDPKNIRGKFAKFDPSQEQSSKLLAGMSGNAEAIGAGTGALAGGTLNLTDANGDGVIDDADRGLNAFGGALSGAVLTGAGRAVGRRFSGKGEFSDIGPPLTGDELTKRMQANKPTTAVPPVSRPKPPPAAQGIASRPTPPKGQKAPPKGPGTLSRMVAGGAVGGIAGSLGGDANAQEDLTAEMAKTEGQISTVQQEIAALKKAKADFDKMTDVKEKQRFLNRAGDYNGAIDGDIKGLTTAGIKAWDARNAAALAKAEKELTASRTTLDDLRTQDAYRQMQKEQNPFFDAVRELGPSGAAVLGGVAATVLRMRGVGKSAKAVKQIENDINDLLTNGPVKGLLKKGGAANQPRNRAVNMNEFYRRGGAPDDKLPFNYGAAGWKPNPKAAKPGSLYSKKTTTGMDGVGSQFLRPTDIKVIGAGLLDSALVTPFVSGAEEELKKAKEDVENGNESIEALRRVEKAKTDLAMYQAIQRLGWGIAGAGALGVAYRYKLPRPDIRGAEDEVTAIADYLKSKAPPKTPRTPKALPPPPAPPQPPAIAASPSQLLLPLLPPPPAPKKPKPKPKKP